NYAHVVFGHIRELGFPIGPVADAVAKNLMNVIANPDYNPYLVGTGWFLPILDQNEQYFTSFAAMRAAFIPPAGDIKQWPPESYPTSSDGYTFIALAAASFLPGLSDGNVTGQSAWEWMKAHVPYQKEVLNE